MKDILKKYDAFYDEVDRGQFAGYLLREVIEQLDLNVRLEGSLEKDWKQIAQRPDYSHLRAAGREFIDIPEAKRLSSISKIIARTSESHSPMAFLGIEPSKLIAGLLGNPASLRSSFSPSAMPMLYAAISAKNDGHSFHVRFIEPNVDVCDFVRLVATVIGVEIEVISGHPFMRSDEGAFDAELCMPPFGAEFKHRETLPRRTVDRLGVSESARLQYEPVAIADALVHARNARIVFNFSSGALFRMVGVEAAAREEMIESGRLATIFDVPTGMLYTTTQITTCIAVLEPEGANNDDVRFIDLGDARFTEKVERGRHEARSDVSWSDAQTTTIDEDAFWARDVSQSDIREQNSILTVARYLRTQSKEALSTFLKHHETRPLADLVEVIRPRAVKKSDDDEYLIREAAPGDIDETGYLRRPPKETQLARGALRGARNQHAKPNDVLLSVKGTVGRVGLVPKEAPNDEKEFWTAGQSLVILRSRGTIKPEVLYEYLTNEVVQDHLRSLTGGSAIQSINAKELAALEIPVPDREEQDRIVEAFRRRQERYAEIQRIREDISMERASAWPHYELAPESIE